VLQITPSERRALQLLARGASPGEIADCLGTRPSELETCLAALFLRMDARNQAEALEAASRRGLLVPEGTTLARDRRHLRASKAGALEKLLRVSGLDG
jgi:DNA-binding CsgD family transcriptional regulator